MTGAGNWTYFLPGREPVLLDAGVGDAAHLEAIAAARIAGPGHVIVSHAHRDHIAGVAAIATRWPTTRFSKFVWPDHDAKYPASWHALRDGDAIPAGDDELLAIHTPGHAPDHLAFWHARSRTMFTGDLVVRGTTVVIPASSGGSLAAYLSSLERVLSFDAARLLPAHGPEIDDPERTIRDYLEHRRLRERQVIDALGRGDRTPEQIAARIYVGLAAALLPMARESVLAHLQKLESERVARRDADGWALN